ncbi:MAG: YlbF family regulator [Peptostreptococcaceae bacterium]
MGVYESATKLAQDIKNSKEYKLFHKSMKEVKGDKKSESLLREYKIYQLQRSQIPNNLLNKDANNVQSKIKKNKKVYNYLENEQNFIQMMNNINLILSEAVDNDYK